MHARALVLADDDAEIVTVTLLPAPHQISAQRERRHLTPAPANSSEQFPIEIVPAMQG